MIRTIRRTVPRPMYIRLPPFGRLLPFRCFGREKTSHFGAGSSAQKQSLGVFDDPQHRQEHVDQSRERDREHRDERAAPGRDYGRDRRRNGHPPDQALLRRGSRPGRDRTARTAESESPARPRWRPLPRRGQPERNPRCLKRREPGWGYAFMFLAIVAPILVELRTSVPRGRAQFGKKAGSFGLSVRGSRGVGEAAATSQPRLLHSPTRISRRAHPPVRRSLERAGRRCCRARRSSIRSSWAGYGRQRP
jgi:hypothetical protein